MNRNLVSAAVVSLGMLVAPPTLAETVEVSATCEWADTGVDVPSDEILTISAPGTWSVGGDVTHDADGASQFGSNHSFLFGALLGRIGTNGELFLVGASYSDTTTSAGRLYLAINDIDYGCGDNVGSLQATITLGDIRAVDAQNAVVPENDVDVTATGGCCCLDFKETSLPSGWESLPEPFEPGIFYSCYQLKYPTYRACKAAYGTSKYVPHATGTQKVTSVLWFIGRRCGSVLPWMELRATGVALEASVNDGGVDLELTTSSEPDTAQLLIYRGEDAGNGGTLINRVCVFNSEGSSDSGATYNCTDNAVGDTYRAAEVEYDGDLIVYDDVKPKKAKK